MFTSHAIECCSIDRVRSIDAADLDGDGDLDLLTASARGSDEPARIAWYRNVDGQGNFDHQQLITNEGQGGNAVHAADLDSDGDLDVIYATRTVIRWVENKDGQGSFDEQHVITGNVRDTRAVHAADLDGDGDLDIVSASEGDNKVAWYENIDGQGAFGEQRVITRQARLARDIDVADLDGDGDLDVVSASAAGGKVAWYANSNARGDFGDEQIIARSPNERISVGTADLNGDGHVDVLHSTSGGVAWSNNADGNGTFSSKRSIIGRPTSAFHTADIDGDGDADLLYAARNEENSEIHWYDNTNGQASFARGQMITGQAGEFSLVLAADFDGDGDLDALSVSYNSQVAWQPNTDGQGTFGDRHNVTPQMLHPGDTHTEDVDGDGDLDLLTASSYMYGSGIAWYENEDGRGNFGRQQFIPTEGVGVSSIYPADLDGDGDTDILHGKYEGHGVGMLEWYPNLDGSGNFGSAERIVDESSFSVYAADFNGDGALDVLTVPAGEGHPTWFENFDERGHFQPYSIERDDDTQFRSAYPADLDNDGDLDVLAIAQHSVAWFDNNDGEGDFEPARVVDVILGEIRRVIVADLDGDGDLDLVTSLDLSQQDSEISWYYNDGRGWFKSKDLIIDEVTSGMLDVADVDGDGDQDVLTSMAKTGEITWVENMDGKGRFGRLHKTTLQIPDANYIDAVDLDGDGDQDFVTVSAADGRITWHENRLLGDSNDDRLFNSSDLVHVFGAGEYEDEIAHNSTYDDGDWNQDGEFNSSDLVLVFREGHYESKVGLVAKQTPAAVDWLFAHDDIDEERERVRRAFVA